MLYTKSREPFLLLTINSFISIILTFLNKQVTFTNQNIFFILFIQNGLGVIFCILFFSKYEKSWRYFNSIPSNLLLYTFFISWMFIGILWTSIFTLTFASIGLSVVAKSCMPLFISIIEPFCLFETRHYKSYICLFSMGLIALWLTFEDPSSNYGVILLLLLNLVLASSLSVIERILVKDFEGIVIPIQIATLRNIWTLPISFAFFLTIPDLSAPTIEIFTPFSFFSILLSAIFANGLSVCSFVLKSRTTSTTLAVFGTASKIISIIIDRIFITRKNISSSLWFALFIYSILIIIYSHLETKYPRKHRKSLSKDRKYKSRIICSIIVLIILVFITICLIFTPIISNNTSSNNNSITSDYIYSSITCLDTMHKEERTCHLKNICYDPLVKEFIYYSRDDVVLYTPNSFNDDFPNPFVSLQRRNKNKYFIQPITKYSSIPDNVIWYDSDINVYIAPYLQESLGYTLSDIFSVYNIMNRFNMISDDVQVLFHFDTDCNLTSNPSKACSNTNLYSLLSNNPPKLLDKHSPFKGNNTICLNNLLVGTAQLGLDFDSTGLYSKFLNNALKDNIMDKPKEQSIILLCRSSGTSLIANAQEVADYLTSLYNIPVSIILDLDYKDLNEQISEMRKHTVSISVGGDLGFVSSFLYPGCSTVFIGHYNHATNSPEYSERHIWSKQLHINDFYYAVERKDISFVRKGVPSDIHQALLHNFSDITINVVRLGKIVYYALHKAKEIL